MVDKYKKIDKEFLLTDSTVNCYGFRLLTSGYLIDEYKKNPIGYNMHLRDAGVLVRWADFVLRDDAVYAKPIVNLSNSRGLQTVDEIENGFLNAASVGHFVVLEISDDESLKLPGQTGPTVTKWFNRECSLVDIPGNYNSLKLFDQDNNEISLSDFTNNNFKINNNMKQVILTAQTLTTLNLKADADATAIQTAIDNLAATAAQVPGLTQKLADVTAAKTTAEKALTDLKAASTVKEVKGILEEALNSKKITVALQTQLAADYAENPTGLKSLIDGMPAHIGIVKTIENKETVKDLAAKTWEELDKSGELEDLKANDFEVFKQKYKTQFKTEYKG